MTSQSPSTVQLLKGVLVAGVVAASLFVAAVARAEAGPGEAEIRVRVVHARNGEKRFDPKLEDIKKFFKNQPFTFYRQVIDETLTLGVADTTNTSGIGLLSGKNLNLTLVALTREKATVRLQLIDKTGQMLDTTVSAGPHKVFFIAGPRYDDGVLYIAIAPHYDPEKAEAQPNMVDSSKTQDKAGAPRR